MTKKEYIIALLTKLSTSRAYADGLKLIVEQTDVQDSVLDGLYDLLAKSVSETLDVVKKESLAKWLTALQKIQEIEKEENAHLDEDLDALLTQI